MWKEVDIREILFEICHDLCQVLKLRFEDDVLGVETDMVEDAAEFFLLKSLIHGIPPQSRKNCSWVEDILLLPDVAAFFEPLL
ncbi:hypothetical protein M7I_8189 [Glarea lozoyensis 74030]|uniref:Uncharacterized protein n=1 Tax=Glarea lozoyensis (strain ATCC 74030 / MF5533) TaxID=1104152 RepID=H0EZC6_GLAL7|nr:hypothetical protein M7I_8189 [Glarea lozoyensis 74030]